MTTFTPWNHTHVGTVDRSYNINTFELYRLLFSKVSACVRILVADTYWDLISNIELCCAPADWLVACVHHITWWL